MYWQRYATPSHVGAGARDVPPQHVKRGSQEVQRRHLLFRFFLPSPVIPFRGGSGATGFGVGAPVVIGAGVEDIRTSDAEGVAAVVGGSLETTDLDAAAECK
jgi:hypothetical protein